MPQDYPDDLQGPQGYCDEDAGRPFRRRVPQSAGNFYGVLPRREDGAGSPLLARGDLYVFSTDDDRLGVGANGTFLVANSSVAAGLNWRAITTADVTGGAALTKTDDANVTLTLGGTPTVALLAGTSIVVGWTGTLAIARGGTGLATVGAAGTLPTSDGAALGYTYGPAQLYSQRVQGTLQRAGERWYGPAVLKSWAAGAGTTPANKLFAFPFFAPSGGTLAKVGFRVTTASAATNARVGVYSASDQGDPWPDALLADGGSLSAGTTGAKTATVSVTLERGKLYWLCVLTDSVLPQFATVSPADVFPVFGFDNTLSGSGGGMVRADFTFGALPAYFPQTNKTVYDGAQAAVCCPFARLGNGTGYLLYDTFADVDGNTLPPHAMNYGSGWQSAAGTWSISGGKAVQGDATGGIKVAYGDALGSDGTYELDIVTPGSTDFTVGAALRFLDLSNWWRVVGSTATGNWRLIEHTASAGGTVRATYAVTPTINTTHHIKAVLAGTSISVYIDGVLALSFTSSAQQTNTDWGLYESRSAGLQGSSFDIFKVY